MVQLPLEGLITEGLDILNKFIPDTNERAAASERITEKITDAFNAGQAAQNAVNLAEAQNPSVFVAGWRPGLGWTLVTILFMWYVPYAVVSMALWAYASAKMCAVVESTQLLASCLAQRPEIGIGDVIALLGSLLGLGTMRTIEKIKGVETTGTLGNIVSAVKGAFGK